jgi:hypothetical protein
VRRLVAAAVLLIALAPTGAEAQSGCGNVVVFATPGMRWQDVERLSPPEITAAVEEGAAAAVAVRTNGPVTSYADGSLTIGAGSRMNASGSAGGPATNMDRGAEGTTDPRPDLNVRVAGLEDIAELADKAGYGAEAGALAGALDVPVVPIGNSDPGTPAPSPVGYGRYALLAAMEPSGVVERAYADLQMLDDDSSAPFGITTDPDAVVAALEDTLASDPCAVAIVDPGDLIRADMASHLAQRELRDERDASILAADDLLGAVRDRLDDDDLLLVVSPTSPRWDDSVHLGLAVAVGPGFEPGSTMRSAVTNLDGVVTLTDVAPTVLDHLGVDLPSEMLGRPWISSGSPSDDRIESLARFAREATYAHNTGATFSTAFVIAQAAMYAFAIALFWVRGRELDPIAPWLLRLLELGALSVVAFPLATYIATPLEGHSLRLLGLVGVMLLIDAALVALVWVLVRDPLDRFLFLVAATFALVVVDQVLGGALQLNAVWGIDPIVAGRFSGLGNISFAILGTTGLLAGALLLRKLGARPWAFALTALVFFITIVVDGAPRLGADVGGVLALVPALGLTFVMLAGKRPSGKTVAIVALGALVALGAFLAIDVAQPPESRTHLARFFEDVRDRGAGAFTDVVVRKARANLRLFRTSIWTYLVPVALGLLAFLVLRPKGAWRRMAAHDPKLRAALIGGMLVGVFGFAVNDSGIVVPAMALSYLVPLALIFHLTARMPDA